MSSSVFATVSLCAVLVVAIIQFLNELYYRKRLSLLGVILMVASVVLMWYLNDLNNEMRVLKDDLEKYQPAPILKGE